jgi:hypothetical protein
MIYFYWFGCVKVYKMVLYGILQFTSKSRIQGCGIPFQVVGNVDSGAVVKTVKVKKERLRDAWAKVSDNGELIEIFGSVGEKDVERAVLLYQYGILPCKYPASVGADAGMGAVGMGVGVACDSAFTVDNADTLDRDDAISVVGHTIGIHITDLTGMDVNWVEWAKTRASSAYWEDGMKGMFPPAMQASLSLDEGMVRPCLSLYIEHDAEYKRVRVKESWDLIRIDRNLTYEEFGSMRGSACSNDYDVLSTISGKTDPADIIAWCMIQYNLHFANKTSIAVLRRVQTAEDDTALYAWEGTHATMGHVQYGHFTSPMRRFADLYNQLVLRRCGLEVGLELDVVALNKKMHMIQQFHRHEVLMSLAYRFKTKPEVVNAKVVVDEEDGKNMMLFLDGHRIYIKNDSYFSWCEDETREGMYEIFGLHTNGKATLRVRFMQ